MESYEKIMKLNEFVRLTGRKKMYGNKFRKRKKKWKKNGKKDQKKNMKA